MLKRAAWLGKGERPTVTVIETCCDETPNQQIEPVRQPSPPKQKPQIEEMTQPTNRRAASRTSHRRTKSEEKTEPAAKEENASCAATRAAPISWSQRKFFL